MYWIFKRGNYTKGNFIGNLHWPFLLYFSWHIIGLIWSSDLKAGLHDLQSKSALLFLPVILSTMDWKKRELVLLMRVFLFGVVISSLIYLGYASYRYMILDEPTTVFFYTFLTSPFKNHPAYISSYCIFGVAYLLILFFRNLDRFKKHFFWNVIVIFFLWLMVIVYSGRMQVLAYLAITSMILSIFLLSKKLYLSLIVVLSILFSSTYFVSNYFSITSLRMVDASSNIDAPDNIRFQLWKGSFELAKKNLFLGVGTGDVKSSLIEVYKAKGFIKAAEQKLNSHNQYFQSLASLGIPGLLLFLLLIFIPSFRALEVKNILIFSFYLIFAIGSLTECMLETQRGSVWLAVFGSMFWGRENFLNDH